MNNRGVSIIITLVILSVLVAVTAGVASIFQREIRVSGLVDDSIIAIIASDAGIERTLFNVRKLGGSATSTYSSTLSNGASYIVCPEPVEVSCTSEDGGSTKIRIEGEYNDIKRAFEITF